MTRDIGFVAAKASLGIAHVISPHPVVRCRGLCRSADRRSVHLKVQGIVAVFEGAEKVRQIGMLYRLTRIIGDKVLLGNIGHIVALIILGEQMVEGLIL
jgi:hypothetical protein